MEEVGIELWLVIERLALKSPSSLVREICYRTNENPPFQIPTGNTPTAAKQNLRATKAFVNLTARYRDSITTYSTVNNLRGIRAALLSVPEFQNGLRMIDSTSESSIVAFAQSPAELAIANASPKFSTSRYPQVWSVLGKCLVNTSLSLEGLVDQIERIVVRPNVPPARWWTDDAKGQSTVYKLAKVGMIKDPPTMELQYEVTADDGVSSIKGRRVLHLEEEIHSSTQPAALALVGRRLAQSHGFLFRGVCSASAANSPQRKNSMENSILRKTSADAELLKWLTKLHQLVKFGRVSTPSKGGSGLLGSATSPHGSGVGFNSTTTGLGGTFSKPPFPTAAAREQQQQKDGNSEVQKADVGLLYRDPEAALRNVDLNSADDYTIQEFKAKMSEGFATRVLKPGDPGYKYDRRVEIKPTAISEWDSD